MTDAPHELEPLRVYGATWCPDCRRAKQFLTSHRVPIEWIDLEENPDQVAEVESRNGGKRIIPTIVFPDGTFLAEPSNDELAEKIGLARVASSDDYDLVIIGGGPTGLTTAIYAARENSRVLEWVFERVVGRGDAVETPIGFVPSAGALDTDGLSRTEVVDRLEQLVRQRLAKSGGRQARHEP